MATALSATAGATPLRSTAAGTCACERTLLRWNCTDLECCSSWWCCRLRWRPRTRRRCCRCLGWRIASRWTWQSLDTSKKKHQEIWDFGFHYHLDHLNFKSSVHSWVTESVDDGHAHVNRCLTFLSVLVAFFIGGGWAAHIAFQWQRFRSGQPINE